MSDESFVPAEHIEHNIYIVRGQRVMLDQDLSYLYGVSTKSLNQQLRRNKDRFPEDFAFRLNNSEWVNLRSQFVTSSLCNESESQKKENLRFQSGTSSLNNSPHSQYGGRRYLPYVFTEHGAVMLASVLHSERAIHMSVEVVRMPIFPLSL